jgi:hypothetical protein
VTLNAQKLDGVRSHLEIRWHAREIHPWDRDLLRGSRKQAAFSEQALVDTEAAISRLFERLPQVGIIELSVLEPYSETLIAAGTVHRTDLSARRAHLSQRAATGWRALHEMMAVW